jgi:hypothetical protein
MLLYCIPGCSFLKVAKVHQKWMPITEVIEPPVSFFIPKGMTVTIGTRLYVRNLKNWKKDHPKDSDSYNDCLSHEHIHASRQAKVGLLVWLFRYILDQKFKLYEEQLGYYISIRRRVDRGEPVNPKSIAESMSKNYFGMITHKKAEEWVNQVIKGTWQPRPNDRRLMTERR